MSRALWDSLEKKCYRLPLYLLLAALGVHGLIVVAGFKLGFLHGMGQDFLVMYTGTRHAMAGNNPYGRDYIEKALMEYWHWQGDGQPAAGFFYPPQSLALFYPFAHFPFPVAVSLWYVLNTALVVACGSLIWFDDRKVSFQSRLAAAVVVAVALLNPLSQRMFSLGQTSFVVPGAIAAGHLLITRKWKWLGAAIWSFAAIKPHLALPMLALMPLLYGLPVAIACAGFIALFTAAGCLLTTGTLHTFIDFLHYATVGPISVGFNQVTYDQILSWNRIVYVLGGKEINLTLPMMVAGYATMGVLLFVRVQLLQRQKLSVPLLLAMAGVASLFCSQPKGYDLVIAVLMVPYLRRLAQARCWATLGMIFVALAVGVIPRGAIEKMVGHLSVSNDVAQIIYSYRAFVVGWLAAIILLKGEPPVPTPPPEIALVE